MIVKIKCHYILRVLLPVVYSVRSVSYGRPDVIAKSFSKTICVNWIFINSFGGALVIYARSPEFDSCPRYFLTQLKKFLFVQYVCIVTNPSRLCQLFLYYYIFCIIIDTKLLIIDRDY